jgi:hypothetical protein
MLAKQRKIRFEDDETHDPNEEEKDTRLKYRAGVGIVGAQVKAQSTGDQATLLAEASVIHGDDR